MTKKASTEKQTRYQELLKILREQALQGEPGSRFASEITSSRRYKVSRSTINRVYSELEQAGYLYRKQGSGTFLAEKHSYRIVYLLPFDPISKNNDPNIVAYGKHLQSCCQAQNIPFEYIEASPKHTSREMNIPFFEMLDSNSVLVVGGYFFRRLFDTLKERKLNVIFLSRQHELDVLYRQQLADWHNIIVDRRRGMTDLVTALARQGCKRIALIHTLSHPMNPFLRGFRIGLRLNDLPYIPQLVIHGATGVEYTQRRLDTLFELHKLYSFDGLIIIGGIAPTVLQCLDTMEEKLKFPVQIGVASDSLLKISSSQELLHLHPPPVEMISDAIISAASQLHTPARRLLNMELSRLPGTGK